MNLIESSGLQRGTRVRSSSVGRMGDGRDLTKSHVGDERNNGKE